MYYTIVLIIATVLLIIGLIIVGTSLNKKRLANTFPEFSNVCPDFWDMSGSVCYPTKGVNTPPPSKFSGSAPAVKHSGVFIADDKVTSVDTDTQFWSGVCDKSAWAKMNNVFWDGVSNNNTCA